MPESSSAPMIEAAGLSKFYGDFAAIRDVCFSIPQGQVAAFLGPNGAGKSTTMKILTGYLAPSSGSRAHRRPGRRDRPHRRRRTPRLSAGKRPALPGYDAARAAQILRTRARPHRRAPAAAHRRGGRPLRSRSGHREAHSEAVQRLPPARRHGAGAAARARRADHGRTHQRPRSQPDPRGPPDHPRAGPEQDHPALHPHPAGSRSHGRPRDFHQSRPRGFRRHARGNASRIRIARRRIPRPHRRRLSQEGGACTPASV